MILTQLALALVGMYRQIGMNQHTKGKKLNIRV